MTIAARAVRDEERSAVEAFYRPELKREVPLEAGQEVFAAREGDAIVAALRLCHEAGTLLLRTVVVAEDRRGRGIGRALLEHNPEPSEYEIREELSGNICRCTGYGRIIEAVQRVAVSRAAQP